MKQGTPVEGPTGISYQQNRQFGPRQHGRVSYYDERFQHKGIVPVTFEDGVTRHMLVTDVVDLSVKPEQPALTDIPHSKSGLQRDPERLEESAPQRGMA